MSGLYRCALITLLLGTAGQAADPAVDLRLLRSDPKTAGFLQKALQDGTTNAAQIEDKLDAMIKGRTLTELARFKQQFSLHGERLKFEKDRKEIKTADGDIRKVGIFLEAEPDVSPSGLVNFRYVIDRSVEEASNMIETETTNTAAIIKSDMWEILSDWGDEKQTTLLIARFSGMTPAVDPSASRVSEVRCQSEIRWCEPSDLKTFERSTPETRSKAITWLIGRSKPIATSGMRMISGQRSTQKNILEWSHGMEEIHGVKAAEDDNRWETSNLGWILNFESTIDPQGKHVDMQLKSKWHPRDTKPQTSQPDFIYDFTATTTSGTTLVIEPKTRPDAGAVPVIFVTPTILILAEGQ